MRFIFLFCSLFIFLFSLKAESFSLKTLYSSDSKPILNLVFCPKNYPQTTEFLEDIEYLTSSLKQIKPFDKFKGFRFYLVEFSEGEEKNIFKNKQNALPPFKVRINLFNFITKQLKKPFKLIVIDKKGISSCAELSLINKTSLLILGKARYNLREGFKEGFLHELGHSLGLRDECLNCKACKPGFPNCAPNKRLAIKWWGDLAKKDKRVSYIKGCCGNKNYIRPTIASLMNDTDKAKSFGPLNERYLRKIFILPLLLSRQK